MNEFETAPSPHDGLPPFAETPPARGEPRVIDHDDIAPAPQAAAPPRLADAPAPPPTRGGGSNLLTVLLFLILAGGLYYVWANPKPQGAGDDLASLRHQVQTQSEQAAQASSQVQTLVQQVQTLSDRLDKLEKAEAASATQAAASTAPAPVPAADLGDLPKRIDDLTARVEALANRPAAAPAEGNAAPAAAPDTAALQQQAQQAAQQAVGDVAQKLEQALAAANTRLDQLAAQQKAADDALTDRLAKVEQGAGQVESAADRAARLARVQAAEVALQAGEKLGPIPNAPPALARFAETPPPTEAALREAFPTVAAHAREVSRPDLAQKSFLQRALSRLQQSVTVRQGDDVIVGDPAAGVLADAETKVQNADLEGAVAVLARLHGPAAQAVQDWVSQANALLDARHALAAMAARP